jgi:hypothetical protein
MIRAARWRGLWLVAALVFFGAGGVVPPASADGECAGSGRIFAIGSETGHLMEIPSCPDTPAFGSAAEVDAADWRVYSRVLAVQDGTAAVLYAVTSGGELWWWRQEASGAALSDPVRIAASINWLAQSVFISRPGYLHLANGSGQIRTFLHQGWASGGAIVSEEAPLFTMFAGPIQAIAGMATGSRFVIGVSLGRTFHVGRLPSAIPEDRWYQTGTLPADVTGAVGNGSRLYALGPAGEVVLLRKSGDTDFGCPTHAADPWEAVAAAPGGYRWVVVPVSVGFTALPGVGDFQGGPGCAAPVHPWEWQMWR